jgi:hypothetical protein
MCSLKALTIHHLTVGLGSVSPSGNKSGKNFVWGSIYVIFTVRVSLGKILGIGFGYYSCGTSTGITPYFTNRTIYF